SAESRAGGQRNAGTPSGAVTAREVRARRAERRPAGGTAARPASDQRLSTGWRPRAPSLRAEHEAHTRYEPHPIRVRQTPFDPDPRSIMVAKLKHSSDSIRLSGTVYRPVAAPYSAIVLLV